MWRIQCDRCKRLLPADEEGAHREIRAELRGGTVREIMLCPDCYRGYEGMLNAFLDGGQDWTGLWGTTTVTITDDKAQTRLDDATQRWNAVVDDPVDQEAVCRALENGGDAAERPAHPTPRDWSVILGRPEEQVIREGWCKGDWEDPAYEPVKDPREGGR